MANISFSQSMIQALKAGVKTQTRRVMRKQPHHELMALYHGNTTGPIVCHDLINDKGKPLKGHGIIEGYFGPPIKCPYGKPGDRLWVKETWQNLGAGVIAYRADHEDNWDAYDLPDPCTEEVIQEFRKGWKWKSSRYMPKWASRFEIEIISVRVERVQDISGEDAFDEGVPCASWAESDWDDDGYPTPLKKRHERAIEEYALLFNDVNRKTSWELNPWVWVIEFRLVKE